MADKPEKRVLLQFFPFSSMIDSSFWHELSRLKLDKLGLNDAPVDISVSFRSELNSTLPSLVTINYESFLPYDEITKRRNQNADNDDHLMFGQLMVLNTQDEFANRDKRQLIIDAGKSIWEKISDTASQAEVDSNLEVYLTRFMMIVYADLKRYNYHYWCSFPALNYPPRCFQLGNHVDKLENQFTDEEVSELLLKYSQLEPKDRLYFVIVLSTSKDMQQSVSVQTFSQFWSKANIDALNDAASYKVFFAFSDPSPTSKYPGWPMRNLIAYIYVRLAQLVKQYPGDPRVAAFILKCIFSPAMQILSVRFRLHTLRRFEEQRQEILDNFRQHSSVYQIVFSNSTPRGRTDSGTEEGQSSSASVVSTSPPDALYAGNFDTVDNARTCLEAFFEPVSELLASTEKNTTKVPPIVGWERNPMRNNQLLPRFIDCSHQLDPKRLSSDAVHLNLKLMKWRLVPTIDLDALKDTRCLLLGAGTLGCNIARSLMAWGVSQITFVDNGTISYSNPVRQTLYTFQDCRPKSDGKLNSKAVVAAEALRLINPGIKSEGIMLAIPMPGHSVAPLVIKSVQEDVKQLETLISEHDVVFLLMDTRESRWLPTLISASMHKTVINVALGFDTYLVQRHGIRFRPENEFDQASPLFAKLQDHLALLKSVTDDEKSPILIGSQLGCYYCNDVFAPGDTTRDRTLDQQCTVTRPGLSMIASGYAVELLASLLQHPAKALAPTQSSSSLSSQSGETPSSSLLELESILGSIPHQIRGFVARTEQITPSFHAFDSCTACSYQVIDKYRQEGFNFLLSVFNDSSILEDITGLKKFHTFDESVDIFAFDSDDEVDA